MAIRRLASIRKILEIIPIPGADFIELAKVDGWKSIVKKDTFKVGDLVVYFEIDSFLPIQEKYEFLRKNCLKKMLVEGKGMTEGFRLKTVRLKNEYSQGLIMPINLFPEIDLEKDIDIDLSEKLGILKYEAPVPAEISGDCSGALPTEIPETDQQRIQNLLDYFEKYKDLEFEETEKEDGTSCTLYLNNEKFGVCGHSWEFKKSPSQTFWKLAEKHHVEEVLRFVGRNIALRGEVVGEGIQKNKMRLKGQHFHMFDIFDIDKYRYMLPDERYEVLDKINCFIESKGYEFPLKHVPILNKKIKIFSAFKNIDDILKYAAGKSFYCESARREGLVFKSVELMDGRVISFKIVDNNVIT